MRINKQKNSVARWYPAESGIVDLLGQTEAGVGQVPLNWESKETAKLPLGRCIPLPFL